MVVRETSWNRWFGTMSRSVPAMSKYPPRFSTPDRLSYGDLNVVNVAPVPDRLKDPVAETKNQNVLYRLFAQIVVDTENLALLQHFPYLAVEFFG